MKNLKSLKLKRKESKLKTNDYFNQLIVRAINGLYIWFCQVTLFFSEQFALSTVNFNLAKMKPYWWFSRRFIKKIVRGKNSSEDFQECVQEIPVLYSHCQQVFSWDMLCTDDLFTWFIILHHFYVLTATLLMRWIYASIISTVWLGQYFQLLANSLIRLLAICCTLPVCMPCVWLKTTSKV